MQFFDDSPRTPAKQPPEGFSSIFIDHFGHEKLATLFDLRDIKKTPFATHDWSVHLRLHEFMTPANSRTASIRQEALDHFGIPPFGIWCAFLPAPLTFLDVLSADIAVYAKRKQLQADIENTAKAALTLQTQLRFRNIRGDNPDSPVSLQLATTIAAHIKTIEALKVRFTEALEHLGNALALVKSAQLRMNQNPFTVFDAEAFQIWTQRHLAPLLDEYIYFFHSFRNNSFTFDEYKAFSGFQYLDADIGYYGFMPSPLSQSGSHISKPPEELQPRYSPSFYAKNKRNIHSVASNTPSPYDKNPNTFYARATPSPQELAFHDEWATPPSPEKTHPSAIVQITEFTRPLSWE